MKVVSRTFSAFVDMSPWIATVTLSNLIKNKDLNYKKKENILTDAVIHALLSAENSYCSLDPTACVILPRNASALSLPANSASSCVMFRTVTSPRRSGCGCDVIATSAGDAMALFDTSMNIFQAQNQKTSKFLGAPSTLIQTYSPTQYNPNTRKTL